MTHDELIKQLDALQQRIDDVRVSADILSPRQRGFLWGAACDVRAVVRMMQLEDQINDSGH